MRSSNVHYCLLLLLLSLPAAQGQSKWGHSSAQWTYGFSEFGGSGLLHVRAMGNTVIDEEECYIMHKERMTWRYASNSLVSEVLDPDYMFERDDVVYLYNAVALRFDTLVNFAAKPGDLWTIEEHVSQFARSFTRRVLDTLSIEVDGIKRRAVVVRDELSDWDDAYLPIDTIVVGIGNTKHYYQPWAFFESAVDGYHEAGWFCGYRDTTGQAYSADDHANCNDLVAEPASWNFAEALWVYDYVNLGGRGVTLIKAGESRITADSREITPLFVSQQLENSAAGGPHLIDIDTFYLELSDYSDTYGYQTVYLSESDTSQGFPLYRFYQEPGSGWSTKTEIFGEMQSQVVDFGLIEIDGHTLRTSQMIYSVQGDLFYEDIAVEGIGNLYEFFLPWDYFDGAVDGHIGGKLRCFTNAEVYYQRDDVEECIPSQLLSSKHTDVPGFQLASNPVGEELALLGDIRGATSYTIWSVLGLAAHGQLTGDRISVDHLPVGTYVLQLQDRSVSMGALRFVKSP